MTTFVKSWRCLPDPTSGILAQGNKKDTKEAASQNVQLAAVYIPPPV